MLREFTAKVEGCVRIRLAVQCAGKRSAAPRRGRRGDVVRLRQYVASQSFNSENRTEVKRTHRTSSGCGRYWAGIEYSGHSDLRRCPRSADFEIRSGLGRHIDLAR